MANVLHIVLVVVATASTVCALECYTCDSEDTNRFNSKCRQDRQRCDQFQDACLSYVRWAVRDVYSARGQRRYYISKGCDTRQGCERRQAQISSACSRDYYNDWACVECCTGDLCNYYVTEGSSSIKASVITSICGLIIIHLLQTFT